MRFILTAVFAVLLLLASFGCQRDDATARHELAAQGIYTGALSINGDLSLIGSLNHGASLWRNADHERLYDWNHQSGEYATLVSTAFSPDGTHAVTADPRTLVVWDTRSGESLAYWTTPTTARDVAILDSGAAVLMGLDDHSAVLFDAQSGTHRRTLLHGGVVGSVDIRVDGTLGLTGSDDHSAVLWDLNTGAAIYRFDCGNPVRESALSATGRFVFTAAQGAAVTLWDGTRGTRLFDLHTRNPGVTSARFAYDENTLLIGYVNRIVELWDTRSGSLLQRWNIGANNRWRPTGGAVLAVAFNIRSGGFLALTGDGRLVELRGS